MQLSGLGYSTRKALQIVANLENIVAVELMCACQALEYEPAVPPQFRRLHSLVRAIVPDCTDQDLLMSTYMNRLAGHIRSGFFEQAEI